MFFLENSIGGCWDISDLQLRNQDLCGPRTAAPLSPSRDTTPAILSRPSTPGSTLHPPGLPCSRGPSGRDPCHARRWEVTWGADEGGSTWSPRIRSTQGPGPSSTPGLPPHRPGRPRPGPPPGAPNRRRTPRARPVARGAGRARHAVRRKCTTARGRAARGAPGSDETPLTGRALEAHLGRDPGDARPLDPNTKAVSYKRLFRTLADIYYGLSFIRAVHKNAQGRNPHRRRPHVRRLLLCLILPKSVDLRRPAGPARRAKGHPTPAPSSPAGWGGARTYAPTPSRRHLRGGHSWAPGEDRGSHPVSEGLLEHTQPRHRGRLRSTCPGRHLNPSHSLAHFPVLYSVSSVPTS